MRACVHACVRDFYFSAISLIKQDFRSTYILILHLLCTQVIL